MNDKEYANIIAVLDINENRLYDIDISYLHSFWEMKGNEGNRNLKVKDRFGWTNLLNVTTGNVDKFVRIHGRQYTNKTIHLAFTSTIPVFNGTVVSGFHGVGVYQYDLITVPELFTKCDIGKNDDHEYISSPFEELYNIAEQNLEPFNIYHCKCNDTEGTIISTASGFININGIVMCARSNCIYR